MQEFDRTGSRAPSPDITGEKPDSINSPFISDSSSLGPRPGQWQPESVDPFPRSAISYVLEAVSSLVQRCEHAQRQGSLDHFLANLEVYTSEEKLVAAAYSSGKLHDSQGNGEFRQGNFNELLRRYLESFPEPQRLVMVTGVDWAKRDQHTLVHFDTPQGVRCLRLDQVFSSRHWGVDFQFQTEQHQSRFHGRMVQAATLELLDNLQSLCKADEYFSKKDYTLRKLLSQERAGAIFERVVQDILNEREPIARRASIFDDIVKKTDLKLSHPDFNPEARVQIKYIADPVTYERQLTHIRRLDEYVMLSPVSIARALLVEHEENPDRFVTLEQALPDGLNCGPRQLGFVLHGLFREAIQNPALDPRGPAYLIPKDLREFIRDFALSQASSAISNRSLRKSMRRVG